MRVVVVVVGGGGVGSFYIVAVLRSRSDSLRSHVGDY